jgi:hypothetical protein
MAPPYTRVISTIISPLFMVYWAEKICPSPAPPTPPGERPFLHYLFQKRAWQIVRTGFWYSLTQTAVEFIEVGHTDFRDLPGLLKGPPKDKTMGKIERCMTMAMYLVLDPWLRAATWSAIETAVGFKFFSSPMGYSTVFSCFSLVGLGAFKAYLNYKPPK